VEQPDGQLGDENDFWGTHGFALWRMYRDKQCCDRV
jgi:hypothetical protein